MYFTDAPWGNTVFVLSEYHVSYPRQMVLSITVELDTFVKVNSFTKEAQGRT